MFFTSQLTSSYCLIFCKKSFLRWCIAGNLLANLRTFSQSCTSQNIPHKTEISTRPNYLFLLFIYRIKIRGLPRLHRRSKSPWTQTEFTAELPGKIVAVTETAPAGNFADGILFHFQHHQGFTQTQIQQIRSRRASGCPQKMLPETAQ